MSLLPEQLDSIGYLTADMARQLMPPEDLNDFCMVEGQLLLDAGQSERGWHRLSTMLRCPQLWAYLYHPDLRDDPRVSHVRHPRSPPLIRGSLYHLGLAHYYRRVMAAQRGEDADVFHSPMRAIELLAAEEDNKPWVSVDETTWWADYVAEAKAAVQAYAAHFQAYERWEILAVEQQLRLFVPTEGWSIDAAIERYMMTLRLDLCYWDRSGYVHLSDHKTRGRRDLRQERGYARSGQFQALRLLGDQHFRQFFGGVMTNYATFQHDVKERAAGAAGDYKFKFERSVPPILSWRLQTFGDTIRYGEWQEQALLSTKMDPFRFPKVMIENGVCEHRYGPCPGAYLCDYGPDGIPAGVQPLLGPFKH
jgi:hypothetical protein